MLPASISFYVKAATIWLLILGLGFAGFYFWTNYGNTKQTFATPSTTDSKDNGPDIEGIQDTDEGDFSEPIALSDKEAEKLALLNKKAAKDPSDTSSNFNILILGIDRRHGGQNNWRTDVLQLITINPKRDRAVVTHIPRDVWAGNYKINAVYNLQGPDSVKDKVQEVTGQRPDRIIRIDFDAFVWAIDGVGGLTIDVPRAFTDEQYPNDREGSEKLMKIIFEQGEQVMDGERALMYVRSRKGNNEEGSDYARGVRQQLVMSAILDDYFKPSNLFKPKTAETLYNIATKKMYTDVSLQDTKVLYELLKNYSKFNIQNLSLNTNNFLEVPSSNAPYGGAWVLTGKGGSYTAIHQEIEKLLNE